MAEDKSAMAAASAAALVASDTHSGRPRTNLEGNALRTPTSAWRGAVHGFDGGGGGGGGGANGPSHSNAGSNVGSPGSTSNSLAG